MSMVKSELVSKSTSMSGSGSVAEKHSVCLVGGRMRSRLSTSLRKPPSTS